MPQLRLHESGVSAMKEIGRSCRVLPVPWQCCPPDRVKTVSKLFVLEPLGLALSEKQIPQIVENTKKCGELKDPLEGDGMRPRQVRYQAALRPDFLYP